MTDHDPGDEHAPPTMERRWRTRFGRPVAYYFPLVVATPSPHDPGDEQFNAHETRRPLDALLAHIRLEMG